MFNLHCNMPMFIKSNFRRPKSTASYEVSQTVQDASLSVKEVATMALNGTLDFSILTPRLDNSSTDDDLDDSDNLDFVPTYGQDLAELSENAEYLHKIETEKTASSLHNESAAPSNSAEKPSSTSHNDSAAPSNCAEK